MPYPDPVYVLLDGSRYVSFVGAVDEPDVVDVQDYSDADNYRDLLDAQFVGRAIPSDTIVDFPGVLTSTAEFGTGDLKVFGDATAASTVSITPVDETIALFVKQDDRFTHTAQRNNIKTRSKFVWKDATGDSVGSCWVDQFISASATIPTGVGQLYPSPTP